MGKMHIKTGDSDYVIAHTSELKEKVQDIMMDM